MAFFNAAGNSSPPTTPVKSRDFASHPSTTPAGPPPSSAASFTPQGPPPSSILGSSHLGRGGSQRKSKLSFAESAFDQPAGTQAAEPEFAFSTTSSNFPFSASKSQRSPNPFAASQLSDQPFGESASYNNASPPKFGARPSASTRNPVENSPQPRPVHLNDPDGSPYPASMLPSSRRAAAKPVIYSNPGIAKRAKLDESWVQPIQTEEVREGPKKKGSAFPAIARDLAARADAAPLEEQSTLILNTEDIISRMYDYVRTNDFDEGDLTVKLSETSRDLLNLWRKISEELTSPEKLSITGGIGPGESAPTVVKTCFISSFILSVHHPPLLPRSQSNGMSSSGVRAPFRAMVQQSDAGSKSPIPKVLVDWINFYHSPQIGRIDNLRETQPNPTSSPTFWDIVLGATLRGDFCQVIQLLEATNFNYARSAMEDGHEQPGYHGAQLQNIQRCVNKAIQLLRSSPVMEHGDWEIKGLEWAMYRKRIISAVTELEDFAEGGEPPPTQGTELFDAPHFGISNARSNGMSFSQSARMADSKVPWTIYQSLKALYGIIIGDTASILGQSQDWVEATIGLVTWWDGDDDNDITLNPSNRRTSGGRQSSQAPRSVDSNPEEAYLRRLDYTFGCVTDTLGNDGFRVNSMNHAEVALASVFEGNVDGVLQILRTWSLPVASAVAEVASFGGWLETAAGSEPLTGLNEDELMVLNYGQREKRLRKDDILMDYAAAVFNRSRLQGPTFGRDGWEVALEMLSRLDDQELTKTKLNEYLDLVRLDTSDQMDRMVLLCTELGFSDQSRKISERYGDKIAETSGEYGTSLICYARAHCDQKIKSIIDLLVAFCLIQSRAYPPTSELDEQLRTLLYDPKTALEGVASVDTEGAGMLQFYFSGYAALRSFYETRDEQVYLEPGQEPKRRPLARKRAAAESLVAAIGSAADCIYGGLYDPDRKTAVQVDGLLVLLGEALALADPDPNRFFTTEQQYTILAAIEDLQTVTPRVFDQCEECLQSAIFQFFRNTGSNDTTSAGGFGKRTQSPSRQASAFPANPRNLLKKSLSSMTGTSGFSVIGSEMLESQSRSSESIGDSGVLVPRPEGGKRDDEGNMRDIRRGWDWRSRAEGGIKGEDILRDLRLRLARGLSLGPYRWS